MLDDAETGKIDLIICKNLSRFGRNYIQVGQYTDYIFPMYNIRFIALNDGIDTANSDSASMDMMPIMNVFNEWHAANTSKKLRAVFESNAKSGKYMTTFCAYGYEKGADENFTPVIDPYAANIVRRIFEMRASGMNAKKIADVLNSGHIVPPLDYKYNKLGREYPLYSHHLWSSQTIKRILKNQMYLGHLCQMKQTTVSYKNHKVINKDMEDWVIIENNHEPIISQELWDKCRGVDASVSNGKSTKQRVTKPLSGLCYCDSCGTKMKQHNSTGSKNPMVTSADFTLATAKATAHRTTLLCTELKASYLPIFSDRLTLCLMMMKQKQKQSILLANRVLLPFRTLRTRKGSKKYTSVSLTSTS